MTDQTGNYHDVVIVGAGLSGVAAAYFTKKNSPNRSFTVLEGASSLGGTWRQHTYPGVRSDSDLYTFGFSFQPWTGSPIAQGGEILDYMQSALDDHGLNDSIQYNRKIATANWSSADQQWVLQVQNTETGEMIEHRAGFLWMCAGYYNLEQGYVPKYKNAEAYKGQVIHPQTWPNDLDYEGKKIVVIGSGATAATLIPALAEKAEHVTMLQRSPTYFFALENKNDLADQMRALDAPEDWVHEMARRKVLAESKAIHEASIAFPDIVRDELIKAVREQLPEGFDVEKHFSPAYRPWQQRIACVPDGDLFKAVKNGKAGVVTDQIDQFTETGIQLQSGEHLDADIIISATGFDLRMIGGVKLSVDGVQQDLSKTVTYRGVMLSDLPNFATIFGYLRTSWTMRSEMVANFVTRLLNHMEEKQVKVAVPTLREQDTNMPRLPFIDPDDFNPGYMQRGRGISPKQGNQEPWVFNQDYYVERDILPVCELDDDVLKYS